MLISIIINYQMAEVVSAVTANLPTAIYAGVQYTPSPFNTALEPPKFDPEEHLAHHDHVNTLTMDDIGLPMTNGISPVAVSEPFPLFTSEAIDIMRAEVFTDEVMNNYSMTSDLIPMSVRGYATK